VYFIYFYSFYFSATSTVVITLQGEALYMMSSSELQRVALSARHGLQIKCRIREISSQPSVPTPVPEVSPQAPPSVDKEEEACPSEGDKEGALDSLNVVAASPTPSSGNRDEREVKRTESNNEINNSTIISVEPETSFGDLTLDSVKDHLV